MSASSETKVNTPLLLLAVAVLVGGFYFSNNTPTPGPGPSPEPDIIGIAEIAADNGAAFLNQVGDNAIKIADDTKAKKFKTTDEAHAAWEKLNAEARKTQFSPWGAAIDPAVEKNDLIEFEALMRASGPGFKAAARRKE